MARTPSVKVSLEVRFGAAQRYFNAARGLPRLSDLEFVLFEKARRDKAAAALTAALLTLAQEQWRLTMSDS
jgi:hypothetical protein